MSSSYSFAGGGGSGGAVDSVNGQTGDVTLDAADVGADPAGTAAAEVTAYAEDADHDYTPADYGFLAWVGDPGYIGGSLAVGANMVHLMRIKLPRAMTITNVIHRQTGTPTLTSNQNFAALYDTAGNRVAVSADQTTAWGAAGLKTTAMTTPYAAPAGFIYAALLFNGSGMPNLGRFGTASAFNNAGLSAANLRFASTASGQTSMPTTITMANLVDDTTAALWCAVS